MMNMNGMNMNGMSSNPLLRIASSPASGSLASSGTSQSNLLSQTTSSLTSTASSGSLGKLSVDNYTFSMPTSSRYSGSPAPAPSYRPATSNGYGYGQQTTYNPAPTPSYNRPPAYRPPAPAPYNPPAPAPSYNRPSPAPAYDRPAPTPSYNRPSPAPSYNPPPAADKNPKPYNPPAPPPYNPPAPPPYNPPAPPPYNPPAPPPYNPPAPPPYNPPAPPPYTPPSPPPYNPPPPPPAPEKVNGSAGLFGDPRMGVFTPGVTVPNALKDFDSGIGNGETVTLLNDGDNGGLQIDVTGIQVDPNRTNSTGIGRFTVNSGSESFQVLNNGTVAFGSQTWTFDQLRTAGTQTLANGATFGISSEIDNASGGTANRFSFQNGEYKMTAALRSPHPDSQNYFDMNFEEIMADAADNATGHQTSVPGQSSPFGIADLLRIEPS
ncbi:MAG: hypothetical protein VKJ04_01670 [Vampirovibrionales bacterium]|nr:hypothetical protein [Vampirovibrionales bacterium]